MKLIDYLYISKKCTNIILKSVPAFNDRKGTTEVRLKKKTCFVGAKDTVKEIVAKNVMFFVR